MNLPSREEYINSVNKNVDDIKAEWNKALFRCPICNGEVKRDYSVVFKDNPEKKDKYRYWCRSCQYEEIF